jgi:diacylglycerol kinase family enzyme
LEKKAISTETGQPAVTVPGICVEFVFWDPIAESQGCARKNQVCNHVRYLIVLNEDAGTPGKFPDGGSPDELRAAFVAAGIDADVEMARPGHIEETLRAALDSHPDALIVGGGDGTVRSAAALLADSRIPLGVLPLGTFNHFAKDLKIPLEIKEAITALTTGQIREIDLGEVNGHVFINNCSIGAYAEAVRRRDRLRDRRGLGKWWAMCRASFEEFRRLRRLRLRIAVRVDQPAAKKEGRSRGDQGQAALRRMARPVRTPVVVIGNNRYSGHLLSQNLRPHLDEGELWLYTVHARRHLAVLRMMFQSLFGQLDEADALATEPATEILIESDCGPLPLAADGEVLNLSAPLHFRIRAGALRVIVPAEEGSRDHDNQTKEEPALVGKDSSAG